MEEVVLEKIRLLEGEVSSLSQANERLQLRLDSHAGYSTITVRCWSCGETVGIERPKTKKNKGA